MKLPCRARYRSLYMHKQMIASTFYLQRGFGCELPHACFAVRVAFTCHLWLPWE